MIVASALYRDGRRVGDEVDLAAASSGCRDGRTVAWIGLLEPTPEEFARVTREFDLHELAVEDAVRAHQRSKLERYGDTLFLVLKPARYLDETETVEFGELHVFAAPEFVITVRHGLASEVRHVRDRLERRPDLLGRGAFAIVHAILDHVVDDYEPVVAGIENDIDEIEDEIFDGDGTDASRRIYELTREVLDFQRATRPLVAILDELVGAQEKATEERRYLRDVHDHALRTDERVERFRELLQNILSVNLTLETKALNEYTVRQNEELKKISGWAAILFAPTLVGTVYGMNFEHMPELDWALGYPAAIALMLLTSLVLHATFKHRDWI